MTGNALIKGSPIELKSPSQQEAMRVAGRLLAEVFDEVLPAVKPGVTTGELDRIAAKAIAGRDSKAAFLGYNGFPATACTSVNEEIVHGIPNDELLEEGDIVGIDIGLVHAGFHADRATTMPVGKIAPDVAKLLQVTLECLEDAIAACQPDNRLHEIGRAVQRRAEGAGFGVVREYSGHGIGRRLHESPQVPNHVPARKGSGYGPNPRLKAGMTLALEPMINLGTWKTRVLDDEWTVITQDELPSAHFEHTVLITENGPEVLTGQQPTLKDLELDR